MRPGSHVRGALGPPSMISVQPVKHLYETLLGDDSLKSPAMSALNRTFSLYRRIAESEPKRNGYADFRQAAANDQGGRIGFRRQ